MRLWVWLSFDQTSSWSDVPPKIRLRIRLTYAQMAGWLANCSWLADWPSQKMSTLPSPKDLTGLGWHFVTWLIGWPIAAGWLANWSSNKMSTWHSQINTPTKIETGPIWHVVRWHVGSGWHLVRCTPQGSDFCEMLQKYFLSTLNYLTLHKISNKSIFKPLRAIWNLHFPVISIHISNFRGLYLS